MDAPAAHDHPLPPHLLGNPVQLVVRHVAGARGLDVVHVGPGPELCAPLLGKRDVVVTQVLLLVVDAALGAEPALQAVRVVHARPLAAGPDVVEHLGEQATAPGDLRPLELADRQHLFCGREPGRHRGDVVPARPVGPARGIDRGVGLARHPEVGPVHGDRGAAHHRARAERDVVRRDDEVDDALDVEEIVRLLEIRGRQPRAALQHEHGHAGISQARRRDRSAVAGPDHERVDLFGGSARRLPHRVILERAANADNAGSGRRRHLSPKTWKEDRAAGTADNGTFVLFDNCRGIC